MRHRESYIPPDTPERRRSAAGVAAVTGAVLTVGALVGVSSAVATADPAPPAAATDPSAATGSSSTPPALARFRTSSTYRLNWERHLRTRTHATPPAVEATVTASPLQADASATSAPDPTTAAAAPSASPSVSEPTASGSPTPTTTDSPSPTASTSASESSSAPAASPSATGSSAAPSATAPSSSTADDPGTADHLFAAASPWNTPIAAGAATDPQSNGIVSSVLTNRSLVVNLNMYAFGIPFYTATAGTPRIRLGGGAAGLGEVPVDPSWRPNEGADHKMNIIDPATHTVFELQGYDPGARSAYWAVKKDYRTSLADGYPQDGQAGPTGSGLTQSGGVIRLSEMASGKIDHALTFITSRPVNRFRYPASHSDGSETGVGLEEGMRVQLDPTLDVDAIPGITPGEKAIAKALQRYGAYCTDTGGGNNQAMGIYVEKPKAGDKDPYPAAGFPQDWAQLPHIPRDRLRVLAASATPRPS